ncbi:tandem-95 repeat protein [Novosphingobium aquae]|uniref:Tandem-95 repeat protein n=1 Tax=Novosphingobium aquae TaxID=3133435 RepID=A0ABU8S8A8_9SPHN
MLINKLTSLFDEVSWNTDSAFRSSIYKIDATFVSRGSLSGSDTKDYFEITPSIGDYQLVVTTEGLNINSVFNSSITVKITNSFGEVLLSEDLLGPDIFTDSITFHSNTAATPYYVEISSFVSVNYRATLNVIAPTNSAPIVSNPIPDQSSLEDSPWTFQFASNTFFDANGDALFYAASQSNGGALPSWLTFNGATRTFSGTPPPNTNGFIDLTIFATDGIASTTDTFRLTVQAVNDAPVAITDNIGAFRNIPIAISVLLNDADVDNDSIAVTVASNPAHGAAVANPNGTITYTPSNGYVGLDSFAYSVSDGHGGTATATVNVQVTTIPDGAGLRLVAANAFAASLGGNGTVIGTNAFQDITVPNLPASLSFDGSFSRGGDVVRLPGNAASYSIMTSGSFAVLTDGDTRVSIPIGTAGMAIVFADGPRTLLYDVSLGSPRLGNESFGSTSLSVTAPPDGSTIPTGVDSDASGRLIFVTANDATFGGKATVLGTNGAEHITLTGGAISLDGSFSRGGDVLTLGGSPSSYSAYISGSFLVLNSSVSSATIPIGTAGMLLDFPGADDRMLRFDVQSGSVKIGTQTITSTSLGAAETLDGLQSSAAVSSHLVGLDHFAFG